VYDEQRFQVETLGMDCTLPITLTNAHKRQGNASEVLYAGTNAGESHNLNGTFSYLTQKFVHENCEKVLLYSVRFEVFTALTMKNGVFWVVTPCGSCMNRRFGGTWRLLLQGDKNR
jgi:hypothetical protein